MSIFLQDNFNGAAGTPLPAHTGESGCGWLTDAEAHASGLYPYYSLDDTKLDGSGAVYANNASKESSLASNVIAPQLDVYIEAVVTVGWAAGDASNDSIGFYVHEAPDGSTRNGGKVIRIYPSSDGVYVYAPYDYDQGDYETVMPFAPPGTDIKVRMECNYTAGTFDLFWNGVFAVHWTMYMPGTPSTPGVMVADIDGYGHDPAFLIKSVEMGTLGAPVGFWTDFVGNISEVV